MTDKTVYSLPPYSTARMTKGELYVLKTNPHDTNDIALHSPQLLSNQMPKNCQMIEAVSEREYVASAVTVDNLPEIMAQRGHAPSFNSSKSPVANPLRPARRMTPPSDAQPFDSEFEEEPPIRQKQTSSEEQKEIDRKEAELKAQIEAEKQKQAAMDKQQRELDAKNKSNNNRGKRGGRQNNQTSLDNVDI